MGFTKIGGAALNQTPFDWENNCSNIKEAIREAREKNIRILCLPELSITGYGCEDVFLSEWLPGQAASFLPEIAGECINITVAVGLPVIFEGKLYNCVTLIKDGNILGFYAKQFLANNGVHYEPRWFSSWDPGRIAEISLFGKSYSIGELIFEVDGIKVGFEICEDAWVNDSIRPACRHFTQNVDLILNPSASHFAFEKSQFRYSLISHSSSIFHCTYLYANLLGNEAGRMIYDGEVLIYKEGELIQRNNRLSFKNYNIISAEIDFVNKISKQEPLSHDEREREYEFWEATTLGLYDYMRKSNSKGFVLSLSGGADSSACAVMVSEMVKKGIRELGVLNFLSKAGLTSLFDIEELISKSEAEQVKTVLNKILITAYQGTKNSGEDTFLSAKELAESIGATFYHWQIENEVSGYTSLAESAIGRKLSWDTDDITLQNIQARSRAPIIWMLANINNALLITTSNRSEGDVGYATMDGDTAGSIAPIAGVDKHFIRNWLIWAESHLDQPGLARVNSLTPTAELRPTEKAQTDEKDLMPYDLLVEIERLAIRDRKPPLQVYQELSYKINIDKKTLKLYIMRFFRLWSRNQWKRERIAPSFHLDEFNVDPRSWCRFPILSGGFKNELSQLENYED